MFVADAGEKQLSKLFAEIAIIVADLYKAVLDDVGHKHDGFCSTFYSYSRDKSEMLQLSRLFF